MDDQAFQLLQSQLNQIQTDIKDLEEKIDGLNAFKWKMYGAYGLFVLVVAMVVK